MNYGTIAIICFTLGFIGIFLLWTMKLKKKDREDAGK